MDISATLVGNSDQLDNTDLLAGPRDFTITRVSKGNAEQPIQIHLAEFPRPWRPGLTMRRLLAAIWGPDASVYVGRRVRLFRDAEVTFGKDKTGGTRLSHASHIDKAVTVTLPISRGKFGTFTVKPLTDEAPAPIARATDSEPTARLAELRAEWKDADPERRKVIEAEVAALSAQTEGGGEQA